MPPFYTVYRDYLSDKYAQIRQHLPATKESAYISWQLNS